MSNMGRPTKFRKKYCNMLISHMASGYSFESFGAIIDVNQDTLYSWAKKYPDFSEAKHLAYNKSRLFWEKVGIDNLHTTVMRKGNMTITKSLNVRVWELNLRNKFKDWRNVDKPDISINNDNRGDRLIIKMSNDEEKND